MAVDLTQETITVVRQWKAVTNPPDANGVQQGSFVEEPRITWTVQSFPDAPEERQYYLDGQPVADLNAAVAGL